MAEKPRKFGDILLRERERLGLSIAQANEATRVRDQLLVAFEQSDFDNMPPRGYSRNMICSYARWLGLDPRKVLDVFEADYAEWNKTRTFDEDPYLNYGQRSRPASQGARRSVAGSRRPQRSSVRPTFDTYGADKQPSQPGNAYRMANRRSARNSYDRGGLRRRKIFSGSDYSRGGSGTDLGKIITIAVIVVVVIILAIVLSSYVRSCQNTQNASEGSNVVTTVPVEDGQTSDTTTGTTDTTVTLNEPISAVVSVADGATSNMTIEIDGASTLQGTDVFGPNEEEYTANTQFSISYTSPESVTVSYTVGDGEPVVLTPVIGQDGVATATVSMASDGTVVIPDADEIASDGSEEGADVALSDVQDEGTVGEE